MDSLFDMTPTNTYEPLPVRMRPTKLDHLYGQEKARANEFVLYSNAQFYSSMKFIVLIKANKMCCYLV